MTEATFTFRVDEDLKSEFAAAAKARDRSAAQLLRDFMRDFVRLEQDAAAHDSWFRQQVEKGVRSADAGDLFIAEEIESRFAERREATRRRLRASE